jgi:hypothetical protein
MIRTAWKAQLGTHVAQLSTASTLVADGFFMSCLQYLLYISWIHRGNS